MITEWEANNSAYLQAKRQLLKEHKGRYAAFGAGRLLGVTSTFEEACELVRCARIRRSIITKIGEEERTVGGEWLWTSLELATP